LGLTISQCRPTKLNPSDRMISRHSRRCAAVMSAGFSASVNGAISMPV
jgi:hypothetical protein